MDETITLLWPSTKDLLLLVVRLLCTVSSAIALKSKGDWNKSYNYNPLKRRALRDCYFKQEYENRDLLTASGFGNRKSFRFESFPVKRLKRLTDCSMATKSRFFNVCNSVLVQ